MKTVKVKGVGIQVNKVSHFKNDIFQVSDSEYEEIKDFVDILKDDKKVDEEKRTIIIEVKDKTLDLKEVEKYLNTCLENFGKEPQNTNDNVDNQTPSGKQESDDTENEELEALKEKAKELGIKITNNMKKETIEKKIEEAENEKSKEGQDQNPEGE